MNEVFGMSMDEVLKMTWQNANALIEEKYYSNQEKSKAMKGEDGEYTEIETFDGIKRVKVVDPTKI